MKGLFVPARTSPMASMARLSICPFSANFEKSWMKARWIGAICFLGALAQAFEILERTAMDFGAQFLERLGVGVGAGKAKHLMTVGDQFLGRSSADKPGRAGNEYTHEKHSLFSQA